MPPESRCENKITRSYPNFLFLIPRPTPSSPPVKAANRACVWRRRSWLALRAAGTGCRATWAKRERRAVRGAPVPHFGTRYFTGSTDLREKRDQRGKSLLLRFQLCGAIVFNDFFPAWRRSFSKLRLGPQRQLNCVVRSLGKILLGAEVSFCRLRRRTPEQQLNPRD